MIGSRGAGVSGYEGRIGRYGPELAVAFMRAAGSGPMPEGSTTPDLVWEAGDA
jgi:hypothetical protein